MRKSRFLFALLTFMMMSVCVFAQKQSFSGTVTDENGEPIIGASVVEKGTSNGSITDIDGRFSVLVEPGTTLVFSYVGYANVEMTAAPNMHVVLREDAQVLDNFVVIGYGVQKKCGDRLDCEGECRRPGG